MVIEPLRDVDVSTDPADNFLLGMAQAGQADYLVTGGKAGVLAIGRHAKTDILTVSKMVSTLKLG